MIYLGLGANVPSAAGPPAATLRAALGLMPRHGIEVVAVSPFYRTPAWPNPADPPFVNAVAAVRTRLLPGALLKALLAVEKAFGRVRKTKNEPRTLDLDLLDYGGLITDAETLMLPHPRMHERAFVLKPLSDIAPAWRHPDTGKSIAVLLANVGEAGVERLEQP
jgi:2-amino-4-hydroxy-6-hydroxymethyldihydropteridine diphosphokinase